MGFNFDKECKGTIELKTPKLRGYYTDMLFGEGWLNSVTYAKRMPEVDHITYDEPATIVFWRDGSKTVVRAKDGESFDKEIGFAMAFIKKCYDGRNPYLSIIEKANVRESKAVRDAKKAERKAKVLK